ncbi:MAG: hypothetical protein ACI4QI_04630 [Candidatus Coproplasma sp.]
MKQSFENPKIEIVKFDETDVITTSTFSSSGTYDGIWNFFDVSVSGE